MTLMLAAASIKVMDALFGFFARNDAECCKRELLGRSWRRDWGMRKFQLFWRLHRAGPGILREIPGRARDPAKIDGFPKNRRVLKK